MRMCQDVLLAHFYFEDGGFKKLRNTLGVPTPWRS